MIICKAGIGPGDKATDIPLLKNHTAIIAMFLMDLFMLWYLLSILNPDNSVSDYASEYLGSIRLADPSTQIHSQSLSRQIC